MIRPAHVGYSLTDNSNPKKPNERIFRESKTFSTGLAYSHLIGVNKSREPRVFTELPMVESHVDVWVDMFLMLYVVKHFSPQTFAISTRSLGDENTLSLYYDRYTMNPQGYHIGYETWRASFPIRKKRPTEFNRMILESLDLEGVPEIDTEWFEYVVLLSEMTVECVSAPESETCDCAENEEDEFEPECQCELYVSPMEDDSVSDFGYQEFDAMVLDVVKNTQACWHFDDGHWHMYADHQLVWSAREK